MFLLSNEYIEIRQTKKKGRGVFVKKDIEAGTVIGDYIGMVIPSSEEDNYDNGDNYYLMYYHDEASIYPDPNKEGIHLINHSCTPNSWMYTYKGHTLYFALRKIFKGEEITVAYLLSPQDKDCNPCNHLCYCGSPLCLQTMHVPDKRFDKWYAFEEKIAKKTKKEKIQYGKELQPLSSYPKIIRDHPIYTLFGTESKKPQHLAHKKMPSIKEIREHIRKTGKTLALPTFNLHILGVLDNLLITKPALHL